MILENTLQNLISATCGSFQLYFYKNLFDQDERSKSLNHKTLNKSIVYQQYINCEKLDFFIANKDELKKALERLQRVLFNLKLNLERLLVIICSLFPKISKFWKDIKKTEGLLKNDLIKQFKNIIRKNGKYSSKIFGKKGLFLERCKYSYFFDGGKYFRIEKNFH